MSGLAQIAIFVGILVAVVLLLRWLQDSSLRAALKKEGFHTQAVTTEIGTEQLLIAKGADGETLVARVKSIPENLAVEVKTAMVPLSHEVLYWLQFADGKRVSARLV